MSDTGVSVGRWPGAADDYRVTVTATRCRDRGRKTLELRTFERNPATEAWSVDHHNVTGRQTAWMRMRGASAGDQPSEP